MKKKILIRIGSLRHGGAEKVLITLLKNLSPEKYDIDLLLNLYTGKYLKEVPSWIHVFYLNKGKMLTTNRPWEIPRKAWRVAYQNLLKQFPKILYQGILKNQHYDIEIAANQQIAAEMLKSPLKSSKKIVWIHTDLFSKEKEPATDHALPTFFQFDKILVISNPMKENFQAAALNAFQRQKVTRIYNPIDSAEIRRKSMKPQNIYSFSRSVPTFMAIGTVYPAKGFDRLLRVHSRLLLEGLPHHILIVGDGYDFQNLQKQVKQLHLHETVTLTGFCDNPYPLLYATNYFVLSSRYEGFPTVLYEAITLKKNIIATKVSGVEEMLEDGKLGMIVENSEEGLYQGIKQALVTPSYFDRFQLNLAQYIAPFDLQNAIAQIEGILDTL